MGINDAYAESEDFKKVSLQFLLSSIEDTVNKYAVEIHFLFLRKESELVHFEGFVSALKPVVSSFQEYINSFKEEILNVGMTLLDSSFLQSSSCLRHDELVELIDSLLQNLVDLHSELHVWYMADHDFVPHAQLKLETLEDKLLFLKNLIHFSILRGVEHCQLEDLLTHIYVVSLNVVCLCYVFVLL
ncbi:hypothetical protein ACH5RR_028427 [Cinchona calisaya]|uniref:Uncharacterized protein n=1 Tax=Cinchona calisaya TaxID=153742 RepID=A0ABD2YQ49_9GENT